MDGLRLGAALGGFFVLLAASAALERLRLHSLAAELPLAPGGLAGDAAAVALSGMLGFTGATLALLTLAAIGWSFFTGVSWLTIFEVARHPAGEGLCRGNGRLGAAAGPQARRRGRARRAKSRSRPRSAARKTIRRCASSRRSPRSRSRSARRRKSRRRCSRTCPTRRCRRSSCSTRRRTAARRCRAETLEFTSRLIEKKLSDFGVAVKVLAAYPGPVITRYEIEPAVGRQGQPDRQPGEGPGARAVGGVDPRGRDHPGQVVHGPGDPEPAPPDRAPVRDPRLRGVSLAAFAARAGARQGHRRQPGGGRPAEDAAPAGGGHHRLGQVGGDQRHDPVAALQVGAAPHPPDPDRPEDARALGLRRTSRTCSRRS